MNRFVISMTVAALAFAAAFAVWPVATTSTLNGNAMAQEPTAPKKETKQKESATKKLAKRADEQSKESQNPTPSEALEKKLAKEGDFEYGEIALQDFVDAVSEKLGGIGFVIDKSALDDAGIDTAQTVKMSLKGIRGDKFLDLTLGELNLTWITRDGYVLITTKEKLLELLEIRVYNCSDLLEQVRKAAQPTGTEGAMGGSMDSASMTMAGQSGNGMGAMGMPGMPGMAGMPGMGGMPGGGMPGMGMGGMGASGVGPVPSLVDDPKGLIQLIQTTVEAEHWQAAGGQGSIEAYPGGLLVINQHGQAHRRIENLLNMMRQARRATPGTVVRER